MSKKFQEVLGTLLFKISDCLIKTLSDQDQKEKLKNWNVVVGRKGPFRKKGAWLDSPTKEKKDLIFHAEGNS